MKRLALGTAQFGLSYGVLNRTGQVDLIEVGNILNKAHEAGMNTLDTAIAYGNSEQCLGTFGIDNWQIITKLPEIPEEVTDVDNWVERTLEGTLQRLRVRELHGLLLHSPQQLLGPRGQDLYAALSALKRRGLVRATGVSIYDTNELDSLFDHFEFDMVQAPFNILDQRLLRTGWLSLLKQAGVEVHTRSVFLQGLLLQTPSALPEQFSCWRSLWDRWHAWLHDIGLTPLQACLRFVLSQDEINRVIVGVDSILQLNEILDSAEGDFPCNAEDLYCDNLDLINPTHWQKI